MTAAFGWYTGKVIFNAFQFLIGKVRPNIDVEEYVKAVPLEDVSIPYR